MKLRSVVLATVALLSAAAVRADAFTPPSAQTTLICTNSSLNAVDHPEDYTNCINVVIPTVCGYWVANGDFTSPLFGKYMRVWNNFCSVYTANSTDRGFNPPPGE
ncbi:hypothetical protein [Anthocerotibacter panamensis]|uniref:hypothetical protein n=1 Tax=Anthocerotibacter panamensis TaxID=2857077 RepID=UPI001C408325|nr:hypothetical protein [Anthocerotibacter panamensis]